MGTAGNPASAKDTDTDATTYGYDALRRLTLVTHPDATTELIAYDARDRITSITNERGKTDTFAYDTNDRLTVVTDPDAQTMQYAYDTLDRVTQVTDRLGKMSSVTFNSRDLLDSALQVGSRAQQVPALVEQFASGFRQLCAMAAAVEDEDVQRLLQLLHGVSDR